MSKSDFVSFGKSWDVLGPLPVGKMELDADPTFQFWDLKRHEDIAAYILSLPDNYSVTSELMPEGKLTWKQFSGKQNGQVSSRKFLIFICMRESMFIEVIYIYILIIHDRLIFNSLCHGMNSHRVLAHLQSMSGKVGCAALSMSL
jgi:hypothetical protein